MSYSPIGGTTVANCVTTVDCQKQVRSWRLLRSLMELLIPRCNCTFVEEEDEFNLHKYFGSKQKCFTFSSRSSSNSITGTIFGYRRGKVSFCIQINSKSTTPLILLELTIPTTILAKEMQSGTLRIALECNDPVRNGEDMNSYSSLLSMPVWTMYCNGRKVGFAIKRRPSKADMDMLRLMESVVVGAGVIDDQLMYLRANFERVKGSSDSESFHLIDPDGSIGQELSIFFHRSR